MSDLPCTLPSSLRLLGAAALLAASLAALAGCSKEPDLPQFAPPCPHPALVPDAADLTRFRGAGRDLTDMAVDAEITAVEGKCEMSKPGVLRTTVTVGFRVARGPALRAASTTIPYFVAVMHGDQILDKRPFSLVVEFPQNADRVDVHGRPVDLNLPVNAQTSGAAYAVMVGFQLTPVELQLNRQRGPR